MKTLTDEIVQAVNESSRPDGREQAIVDRHKTAARKESLFQEIAQGEAELEIEDRRQKRAYAEKPPTALAQMTVDPAREMLANLGDRAKVLDVYRKLSPEQRQEALKLAPGIAQIGGDDRGGFTGRVGSAVARGITGVSQPIMELFGGGGSAEEIEFIRKLEGAAAQEFNPALPGDPWYERGPLQAVEMLPWMATTVGGAGLGRTIATGAAGRIAASAAAGSRAASVTQKAGQAIGSLPTKVPVVGKYIPALTAGKAGELAGITAAAFPAQYAQEVDQLKAIGMVDDTRLRLLAGGTAAVTGLVEGIVPNPFGGKVALTEGAAKAARQYLWEAAKKAPGELTEEYLQGVTSGLGEHVAQYIGSEVDSKNADGTTVKINPAQKKTIADAFSKGWKQTQEAALPMAFLLGGSAIGGAGMSAAQARYSAPASMPQPPLPTQPAIGDTMSPPPLPAQPPAVPPTQQSPDPIAQRIKSLEKAPSAHKWAEVVLGDRKRFKEAPDEATRIQQWEQARGVDAGQPAPVQEATSDRIPLPTEAPKVEASVPPEQSPASVPVEQSPAPVAVTPPNESVAQFLTPEWRAKRKKEIAERPGAPVPNGEKHRAAIEKTVEDQIDKEIEMLTMYPPGTKLMVGSYEEVQTVMPDGKLLDASGRTYAGNAGTVLKDYEPEQIRVISTPESKSSEGVDIKAVKSAIGQAAIGRGGNAIVYDLNESNVVRVPKGIKDVSDDFKPVDHPANKLGLKVGQPVFENSQGVQILQKQKGTPAGLQIRSGIVEKDNADYAASVKSAANMPQSAFDEFARTLKVLSSTTYGFDPSKSNNVLIDSESGQFNLVDIQDFKKRKSDHELLDMVIPLAGNTYANRGVYKGESLAGYYQAIIDKSTVAAKKHGLRLSEDSPAMALTRSLAAEVSPIGDTTSQPSASIVPESMLNESEESSAAEIDRRMKEKAGDIVSPAEESQISDEEFRNKVKKLWDDNFEKLAEAVDKKFGYTAKEQKQKARENASYNIRILLNEDPLKVLRTIEEALGAKAIPDDLRQMMDASKPVESEQVPTADTPEEHAAIPMFEVYRSSFKGKKKFFVKEFENKGNGDSMFDSLEEANKQAELVRRRDADNKASEEKRKADEEAGKKKQADYEASFGGFLSDNAMNKGRQLKVLGASRSYQGKVVTVKDIVEQNVANGAVVDDKGRLMSPDGSWLGSDKLTKIGIDYARHLIEAKAGDIVSPESKRDQEKQNAPQTKKGGDPNEVQTEGRQRSTEGQVSPKDEGQTAGETPSPDSSEVQKAVSGLEKMYDEKVRLVDADKLSKEQQEAIDFIQSKGKTLAFYEVNAPSIGWYQVGTDVILVNNKLEGDALWGAVGHELAHATGLDEAIPFDSAELQADMEAYYEAASPRYKKYLKTNKKTWEREGRARMVQRFFEDSDFRDSLKQSNPTMWESIREAVLKFIGQWVPEDAARKKVLEELRAARKPKAQTGPVVADAVEPTADEIDAMMDEIMSKMEESQKVEPKKPSAAKPRKYQSPKKSEKTKATAEEKLAQAKQAMRDAFKGSQGKPTTGLDPEVAMNVAKAAKLYIEAGILNFKSFIERLAEDFNEEWVRDKAGYLESAWRVANKRGWVNSPVGEVAKILPAIEPTTAKFAKGDKVLVGNKSGEIVMPPQFVEKTGTYRALVRLVDKDGKAYEQFHDVENISADSKSSEPKEQVEKLTYKELRLGFEDYKTTNRLSSGAGSPALWQQVKQVDGESVFTYYVVDTTNESVILSTSDYDQAKATWDKQTELFNANKAREQDRLYEESEKISKAKKKAISDDLENRKSQDAQTVSAQDLDKPLTGKPIIVTGFHGSKDVFEEFDPSRRGETDPGFLGPAYYFYADEALAKKHGENVIRRDLRINKPLDYAQMMAAKAGSPLREVNERYDEVYDREMDIALAQEREGLGDQPAYWRARAAALATVAKEFGYDGVVMRGGVVDDFPNTEIAVFDPPQQTKSGSSSQPDKLKQHGLKVERVGSRWVVSGKTFNNKQILKDVGGQYDVSEKNWWFRSDPTNEIAAQLPDKGDGEQSSDGGDSDADVERKRVRSREAERPDERGTRDSAVESVGDDTKQLIQRGEKFGIPKKVLEGQVEDIGRVTQAFEAGKPMFLVGSAPGMGKSFILGGSIAEIRKRINSEGGTSRFIYVTENQELIGQLKRDLADYGVEDVEFVTYAGIRGKRPNANGAVVLVDEAHNAKNLETKNGEAIQSMVSESDFTVYATATPFENVAEAKYLEASGVFDGVEAVIKRKDDGGKPYDATIVGFDAWAFAYGAELYWPKNAPRPVIYWHKHTTAEEGQIQANDWMAARGVYTQRPMVLPPEMVKSDLRAVTVDDKYAEMFEDVLGAYAEAEANADNAMEAGMIRAHGINLQKRILEASKVNEGIARAKDLIADGKQVIIFVNTKADRAIGRYRLSEPYRKHHGIKGESAEKLYTPSQIADMMDEYQLAKRASREMGGDAGPAPFAKPVVAIAEAMGNRGIDFSLPSVTDELLSAFPDGKSVEYTGRLTDAKAKDNLGQWKSGKAKVIVATMDKGGTGLSYHDTTGKMPERVQVNINLPWSGTQVEQVSGRLARLGTAKPVGIEWIFADNIPFERELSKTVGSRMRSMQAAVQGSLGDMAQSIKDFEFGDAPSVPEVTPQQIRELKQRVGELEEQGGDAYEADLQLRDAKEKLAQQRLDAGEPYTIVVVACGDKKKGYRAAAQDLYDGDLFKKSRVWAERNSDEWVIASAKHGLLEPGTFVDPYNKKLGASAGDKSAAASLFAVGPHLPKNLFENGKYKPQAVRVIILGGKDYADAVKSLLPDSVIVEEPLQGKQIGERLQWLKQQNESEVEARDRVQQIQDTFPLNQEQAIAADILMDAMALPGEIEIALPGTPIPGDSLSQSDEPLSDVDADAIPKAVLDKMSRRLKSMGYDTRGAEDVRRAIKQGSMLNHHADYIAAYRFATGSEQARKEKAATKQEFKNVNWARLNELGTTTDPKEAGYIKPDGTFADLSGKREGGSRGTRSFDHREAGGTAGMQEVMAYGWVRMDENSGSVDIAKLPTAQQLSAITRMAERHNGELVVDLEDGLGEWSQGNEYYRTAMRRWSQQYPEGTRPKRIINDIKKFFAGDTPNTLFQKQIGNTADMQTTGVAFGYEFATGQPVTFTYRRNTESATGIFGKPKKGDRYGRDLEPSGEYMIVSSDSKDPGIKNWIAGERTFQNPLVIETPSGKPVDWKKNLSKAYGGKTGKKLSLAIISDGFDGIVTVADQGGIGEIVDLTTFEEGKALFQKQRDRQGTIQAWTHFVNASKAVIGATDQADVSSFFHELGHPMRRFLFNRDVPQDERGNITDEDIRKIEDFVGVEHDQDGKPKWDTPAEERFVDALMSYWMEGKSPTKQLETIFQKISKWLSGVLSVIARKVDLTDDVRSVFDKVHQRGGVDPKKMQSLSESKTAEQAEAPKVVSGEVRDVLDDLFGDIVPSEVRVEALDKIKAAGIEIKQKKNGWSVTGLPDNLSKEMRDGIKAEGGRRTVNGYFFKNNPTNGLVPTAEAIIDANREADEAAAAGLVRTPIGNLSQEKAERYEEAKQQRLEIAKQMLNASNNSVDELLGNFIAPGKRGLFKISLQRAAETGDPDSISRFDEMIEYSVNHPELGLPQDEQGLFERLLKTVIQEEELVQQIDDDLANEFASLEEDTSFDFGFNVEPEQLRQTAIEGLEEDVARKESNELFNAKQDKYKQKLKAEIPKMKQQMFLTDIYGNADQGTLFDTDGSAQEDDDLLFQASESPVRQAGRVLKSAIESGAKTFEEFIEHARTQLRDDQILQNASNLETLWSELRSRGGPFSKLGPVGSAAELLKPVPKNSESKIGDTMSPAEEDTTGTKHAKTDELRARSGLPERISPYPETFQEWEDQASREYPDAESRMKLIEQAERHPERVGKIENAAIGQHIVYLDNLRQAGEDVLDELLRTIKVANVVGSEAGRALVSRKAERYSDFSLAGIIGQHIDTAGNDPTAEQIAKYEELADRIKKLENEKLELAEKLAKEAIARKKAEEAAKPKPQPVKDKVGTKQEAQQKNVAVAVASFKDKWNSLFSTGETFFQEKGHDPEENRNKIIQAATEVIKAYGADVASFLELQSQLKGFGINITDLAAQQTKAFKAAWDTYQKNTKVMSPIGVNPEKAAIGARAKDLMKLALEAGYGATPETWKEVIDVVHAQLSIEVPGISEYDTMQAISDYGVWRPLNKEEIAVKTRAIRGKARQSLKIEDAIKAIAQSEAWLKSGMSPEEVARRLRDMNWLPKATGSEQATPDSIERELIAEFNKLKKDLPVSAESREGQLKSALTTAKTAGRNRLELLDKDIKALEEAIATPKELVKPVDERTALKPDEDLLAIRKQLEVKRKQRDDLKAKYETIFPPTKPKIGRKPLTDEQRLAMSERMLQSQIDAVKEEMKALESGTWTPAVKNDAPTSIAKEALKAELAALKQAREQARQSSPVYQARKEAKYWEQYRKSQEKRLEFWEKRRDDAAAGNTPVPFKKRTITEESILDRNLEIEKVQYEAMYEIEKAKRANWNAGQWINHGLLEATSLIPKTLMLGMEMSYVLRQGFFYARAHPIKAFAALVDSIPAVWSQRLALASMEDIKSRPNAKEYELAKIDFTQKTGPQAKLEEMYQSSVIQWLERTENKFLLPLRTWVKMYGMFESGNRTFANIMKADLYDIQKRDTLAARELFGVSADWTESDIKETGRIANIFSGRGTGLKGGSPWLDFFFLARRWLWSRIQADFVVPVQLMTPKSIGQWNADRGMRVALAKLYIQTFLGHATKLAMAYFAYSILAGDDEEYKPTIEWDPRASDAWSLKIGETRIKDEGGLMPAVVLAARIATGEMKTGGGEVKSIYGEDVQYGGKAVDDFVIDFARYKLGTGPSAALELMSGRDSVGKVIARKDDLLAVPKHIVTSRITPLTWREVAAAERELGVANGTLASLESFFGVSVSTHGDRTEYRQANAADKEKKFDKDIKKMKFDSPDPAYKKFLSKEQMSQVSDRREDRRQGLVYEASSNPIRKSFKNDKTFDQAVKERDAALENMKKSGMSLDEARGLLIKHWESNYGGAKETRGGVRVYKEALSDRLRQLRKAFPE